MIFWVTVDHCVKKLSSGNKIFTVYENKTGNEEIFKIDTWWTGNDNNSLNFNQKI